MHIPGWLGRILVKPGGTMVPVGPDGGPIEGHAYLLHGYHDGRPLQEPVHAHDLGGGRFRLLYSPGMVRGIAAGDEFAFLDDDGAFDVLHRGGNLAVRIYTEGPVDPIADEAARRVAELGGVLDGRIDTGMVFTIPAAAGLPQIEAVFAGLGREHPGLAWEIGNPPDPDPDPSGASLQES